MHLEPLRSWYANGSTSLRHPLSEHATNDLARRQLLLRTSAFAISMKASYSTAVLVTMCVMLALGCVPSNAAAQGTPRMQYSRSVNRRRITLMKSLDGSLGVGPTPPDDRNPRSPAKPPQLCLKVSSDAILNYAFELFALGFRDQAALMYHTGPY